MISFGIMTAVLLALTCVVHYDLLSLFLPHPYGRRIMYADNEQQQYRPRSEADHVWIPKPGTAPNTSYFLPQPVILQVNSDDGEDFWTDSDYDVGGAHNNRGTLSNVDVHQQEPASDTVVVRVPTITTTEVPDDSDDNYVDDDDYVAPEQEWDDDVF
ncbi:PREDICTED: uncharacterized protein LOC107167365 [Diuraphis noxia]|uniref:uncharacterized protein LOC107167365 n=1 Tax=Diuraphis noxia TaxID=143948 RepID=UPI0007637F54|nr:PREDICTED: uncharacterized protein LOC107167365 [Diuraphis noxia]